MPKERPFRPHSQSFLSILERFLDAKLDLEQVASRSCDRSRTVPGLLSACRSW